MRVEEGVLRVEEGLREDIWIMEEVVDSTYGFGTAGVFLSFVFSVVWAMGRVGTGMDWMGWDDGT